MAFSLWLMGLEQGSHSRLLEAEGHTHGGISFWGLKRRLPKTKPYLLADRMPEGMQILLDSGGYSANRSDTSPAELEEYSASYEAFVVANLDRVSLVTEFDCMAMGQEWIEEQRRTFWDDVPLEKFVPVWHGDQKLQELDRLAQVYDNVGIPESALAQHTTLAARVNTLSVKYGTSFHALACAKPDNLRAVRFDTAATTSWLSPMKYGETIVWDGTRLHRYTAAYKDQARKRHKMLFIREGFDYDKILADDPTEVARFTLWSFRQLETFVDKRRPPAPPTNPFTVIQGGKDNDDDELVENVVTNNAPPAPPSSAETPFPGVDNSARTGGNPGARVQAPRKRAERTYLPVVGFETKAGNDDPDAPLSIKLSTEPVRQCDTCYVMNTCPAFQEGSECAFELPVELKTQDQYDALMNALIEMQTARVMFGRFAEEQNGGYMDPNVSQEQDRLMRMIKMRKDILDNSSYVKMSIQTRGEMGVLSQIFGSEAKSLRNDKPVQANIDRMLDSGHIVDAELVE